MKSNECAMHGDTDMNTDVNTHTRRSLKNNSISDCACLTGLIQDQDEEFNTNH